MPSLDGRQATSLTEAGRGDVMNGLGQNRRWRESIVGAIFLSIFLSGCASESPTAIVTADTSIRDSDCLLIRSEVQDAARASSILRQEIEDFRAKNKYQRKWSLEESLRYGGLIDDKVSQVYTDAFTESSLTLWTKLNDPDLKELTKSLSRGEYAYESYTAMKSICGF
jgi:hypothetical protein